VHPVMPGSPVSEDLVSSYAEEFIDISSMNEIVTGDNFELKNIDGDKAKLDVQNLTKHSQDQMSIGIGIPKILLGIGESSLNRATGDIQIDDLERKLKMWQQTPITDELKNKIFNPYLVMQGYDTEDIYSYKLKWNEWNTEDETVKSGRLLNEYNSGLITLQEYRNQMGYLDKPEGDFKAVPESPINPFGSAPNTTQFKKKQTELKEIKPKKINEKTKESKDPELENDALSQIDIIFKALINEAEKLKRKKLSKKEYKLQTEGLLDILNNLIATISFSVSKFVNEAYIKGAEQGAKEVGMNVIPSDIKSLEVENLKQVSAELMDKNVSEIVNSAQSVITEGVRTGLTPAQMVKQLQAEHDVAKYKIERVVRTESSNIANSGRMDSWGKSNSVIGKGWIDNKNACPLCKAMADKYKNIVVPLDQPFSIEYKGKTYTVNHPTLHPNCTCSVVPITIGEVKWLNLKQI